MAVPFGRKIRPINQVLYAIPGDITFTVPENVYSLTLFLRGAGGGAGGGGTNSYDGYSGAAGGSGYSVQNVTISVVPGQKISGVVGRGGEGGFGGYAVTPVVGQTGGTTSFGGYSAAGGQGGQPAVQWEYSIKSGGIGEFNGSNGGTSFSEYYLGGCGAGTTEHGIVFLENGINCLQSRGGNSSISHTCYNIQQFPQGHTGASNTYGYSSQYTAYYGGGGGGAGDFGNGTNYDGGLGGGGGAATYWSTGGRGGDGYILLKYQPATLYTATLPNLDAELGNTTGWTVETGGFSVRTANPAAHSGTYYFMGSALSPSVARYRISITSFSGLSAASIDAGLIQIRLNWWQSSWHDPAEDYGGLGLRFSDSSQTQISIEYASLIATQPPFAWVNRSFVLSVPATTRYVDIMYQSIRTAGTNNDTYIDDISITPINSSSGTVVSHLLLNGADGSTSIVDETGKTWTRYGQAQISTTYGISGGSSLKLDGSGDYVKSTHTDFALGVGNFTVEFWMRPSLFNSVYQRLIQFGPNATTGGLWIVEVKDVPGSIFVQTYSGGYWNVTEPLPAGTIPLSAWSHVAVTRCNGVWKLFVNGVGVESGVGGLGNNITQTTVYVGSNSSGSESYNGYIDNVRITKGTALYTSNFVPPTV